MGEAAGVELSGSACGSVDGPEAFVIEGEGFGLGTGVEGAEILAAGGELGDGGAGDVEVAEGVADPDGSVGVEDGGGIGAGEEDAKLPAVGIEPGDGGAGR